MKKIIILLVFPFLISCSGNETQTQNISIAIDLYEHNLKERAMEEFIMVYNSQSEKPEIRSEALYYMGQITFDQNRFSTAVSDWKKLIEIFPTSDRAMEIKDRLEQLNEVFLNSEDENISSSIAQSYINNGDFWSDDNRKFTIDASWLPKAELAIDWYDKTILEFPKTYAAELAYQRKLFSILDVMRNDYKKYLPVLLQTFDEFEKSFPENSFLQGFRYQISQKYWGNKDWDNTRIWLNKIIDKSKGQQSFYSETAKARLNKIEY